jgi:hypothetical protein
MRNPVVSTWLVGDVVAQLWSRNPWCTECIQCDVIPIVSQLRSGKGSNRASERMSCRDDLVVWVRLCECLKSREDVVAGINPGLPEAPVGSAATAEIDRDGFVVEIGDPVVDGGAAAEGDDDKLVFRVGGDVASYVCTEGAGDV